MDDQANITPIESKRTPAGTLDAILAEMGNIKKALADPATAASIRQDPVILEAFAELRETMREWADRNGIDLD